MHNVDLVRIETVMNLDDIAGEIVKYWNMSNIFTSIDMRKLSIMLKSFCLIYFTFRQQDAAS